MAAKGSVFSTSEYAYDIFLSFRGEDTRKTFTARLYNALVDSGFGTFIDDNGIERGENIKSELTKAIQHSRGSIIVLSKDYANSSWCLDELVMILENKRRKGHVILPLFYYVSSSQVGRQMGSFAEAFAKYEERVFEEDDGLQKMSEWRDKIQNWRIALTEVAALGGMSLKVQDEEGLTTRFIHKTVEVMQDKLNRAVLTGAQEFVGIGCRVKDINAWLQDESSEVGILVICGIGGIGKTTIAKFLYNLNYERFQTSSFLAEVRGISEQPNGLVCLQRKLISDILGGEQNGIDSVVQGTVRIKAAVGYKRILLVLDDVDQVDQLDAILGLRDWLHPGSKIIITTRHESLLKPNEVYKIHKIKLLDYDESLQLFSWYAFGQDYPLENYMEFSIWVINKCNGLPLALKVFGSSLFGKSLLVWESMLRKLNEVPSNQVQKLLQISYESLPDDEVKKLFLHIACFFAGKDKDYIVKILDECGIQTLVGIQTLMDRSLLTIDVGLLRMHQSLQDMGRGIVRKESPRRLEMRSRLWRYKDSLNVLKLKTGTEATEGLILDMRFELRDNGTWIGENNSTYPDSSMLNAFKLEMGTFRDMKKLELLQLDYVNPCGRFEHFPKKLKWLRWRGFPLKSMPNSFTLDTLIALDMSNSSLVRFWKQNKTATFMKVLDLGHSHMLRNTPEFSGFPSLETLILKDCISLSVIHKSIGHLERLSLLDLQDCKRLCKLPKTIVLLRHLETLIISGCTNLHQLPNEMNKMKSLKVLNADGIDKKKIFFIQEDIGSSNSCVWPLVLKPRKVPQFSWASLPHSLMSLSLADCSLSEDTFPKDIGNFSSLKELNLSRNSLSSLPQFVSSLDKLQILHLESCNKLTSILGLPDIKFLRVSDCGLLKTITHVSTSSKLQEISRSNCINLVEIQGLFHFEPLENYSVDTLNNLSLFNLESLNSVEVIFQDGTTFTTRKLPIHLLYEFGIFSTSVPGTEIPNWFSYKITGSLISFTVPSTFDLQLQGLNIFFVYTLSISNNEETWFPENILFIKISNKTKDLKWIYFPTCFGIPETDQELLWLSHWTFQNQLENGDEIDVSIITGDNILVKEFGVNFLYHGQQENFRRTFLSWREVIGGDLSAFQLSNGDYYLCRTIFLRAYEEEEITRPDDWTTTNWGRRLFEGSIDFKEIRVMSWMGRHKPKGS